MRSIRCSRGVLTRLTLLALTFLAMPAGAEAFPASSLLRSGPMLGYSEIQETVVWLQTWRPARAQLRFWPDGEPAAARLSEEVSTHADGDHIARFVLGDLRFGTRYGYELYLDGERVSPVEGETSFRTQPMWRWRTDPPEIRAVIGSCAYVNDPPFDRPGHPYGSEPFIFETLADQKADFMLWLGDNVYQREADWLSDAGMRNRYAHTRSLPEMQRFLASTHQYALWDDHDFGPDNSDRTFRLREESLRIFRDYWGNPSHGTLETPGTFTRFEWGDVEFFLLDNRFYRSPNHQPAGPEKVMFGPEQMAWLREALVSSKATFKIVASGNQMLNDMLYDPSWQEMWELFPHEKRAFFEFLADSEVEGVVLLSGDRHHTELLRLERPGQYPLYEFTSSPLTAGVANAEREVDNPLRVPGTFVRGKHNFGALEITGPAGRRVLTLRTLGTKGEELWSHSIEQAELSLEPN